MTSVRDKYRKQLPDPKFRRTLREYNWFYRHPRFTLVSSVFVTALMVFSKPIYDCFIADPNNPRKFLDID